MKVSIKEIMKNGGAALDTVPDGTRITGVYYKRSKMEVIIEKRSGYRNGWDITGLVGRVEFTEWAVAGYADPYIKSTLRAVLDGTSRYYELHE